jgi:hypothetical protein
MAKIYYFLVLVDDKETAAEINDFAAELTTPNYKLEAIEYGRGVCGLRHGPQRPNTLIDLIKKHRNDERFDEWYAHIRAALAPDTVFIGGTEE